MQKQAWSVMVSRKVGREDCFIKEDTEVNSSDGRFGALDLGRILMKRREWPADGQTVIDCKLIAEWDDDEQPY